MRDAWPLVFGTRVLGGCLQQEVRKQIDSLVLDVAPGLRVPRDTLWRLLSALGTATSERLGSDGLSACPVLPRLLE